MIKLTYIMYFVNKLIDIYYYTAKNSCMTIKELTINMFFLFPSVFYYYLKRNCNVLEITALPKCMYT